MYLVWYWLVIKAKSYCKDIFPAAPEHNWDEISLEIGTRENTFIASRWSSTDRSLTILKSSCILSVSIEDWKTIIKVIHFDLSMDE